MNKVQGLLLGGLVMVTAFAGSAVGRSLKDSQTTVDVIATVGCDTDSQCAATPACALKPGCDGSPTTEPYRLVGIGCMGGLITFPIYRDEEDEFPAPCVAIEATF